MDAKIVADWSLYENLSMSSGVKLKKLKIDIANRPDGGSDLDILFQFVNADAASISRIKEFRFEDWTSRWSNEAAANLSITLPASFDGLYILPRVCTPAR